MSRTRTPSQPNTHKIVLITLGVLLLSTVFLLPQFVQEPWFAGDVSDQQPVPTPSAETVAPSTAAELKRYRQESQTVLAEIILKRDRLRERHVELWAQADFQHALGQVEIGDEEYSYGNYSRSLDLYRQARAALSDIEKFGEQTLAKAKTDGFEAVESLNQNIAQAASALAHSIAPEDPDVQALVARAETLPQVAEHIEAGDYALDRDRFSVAQTEYRKALGLDPAHKRASESLSLASREVTGGAFRREMSRGFDALENDDFDTAISAFRSAGEIQPGNPAVSQALAQVANRESMGRVNAEMVHAVSLEANEQWAEAVAIYESLLEEDPSLTDVRVKLIPARVRAELDTRLSGYIDEPLRLSNKAEFDAAQITLQDARGISNSGPRLNEQIAELDTLVQRATSAVNVVFRSDNQTHVVLFRVADLGQFEQTSMRLRPGRYVAAGTRQGFRDVRVEFTITGEPLDEAIVVRCEEPVG
jgi:tetratricopeptide (TPR) repeat protein